MQNIEDLEAVRRLLADYCFFTDARDHVRLCELFTDDFALTGIFGDYHGKEGMRQLHISRGPGWSPLRHLLINAVIDLDDDRGTGRSYIITLDHRDGQTSLKQPGCYSDRYVKLDGRWLFQARHIHAHPAETLV